MKKLVLLIDDEEIIRLTSGEILIELGFDVITAGNGNEGLDVFRKRSSEISLVILDMTLPDKSGMEIFNGIKAFNPAAKILLTSGFTQDMTERDIEAEFIQKPYTISDLNKKIHELII